jgi:uncharacterized protein (DUF849 family)
VTSTVITRIKACLNGSRPAGQAPTTPAELAAAASGAVDAGAEAVHLHARGPDGRESLSAQDIGAAVEAVRSACPGTPIGVSTGLWIVMDGTGDDESRRYDLVSSWTALDAAQRPDFASVNVREPGFADLTRLLNSIGVGVEAGVWAPEHARLVSGLDPALFERVLVEIIDVPASVAVDAADAILAALDVRVPVLLHGEEDACWPIVAHAGRLRLATRIGLEDTLVGPGGEPTADNADLVRAALAIWVAE